MGTKNISFTEELEKYIDAKVASGEYAHASEVVRDGVRLLMHTEAERLEWLKDAIAVGMASAETEDLIELDEAFLEGVKARGLAYLRAREKMA